MYTYKNCNSGYARIYKNRVTSYYKEAPGTNGFTIVPENPVAPQTTVTLSYNFRFQIAFLPELSTTLPVKTLTGCTRGYSVIKPSMGGGLGYFYFHLG